MHERIIEHINRHDGVRWATMDEIADDFAQRYPRGGDARPSRAQTLGVEAEAELRAASCGPPQLES